jgi:hypothetical protein
MGNGDERSCAFTTICSSGNLGVGVASRDGALCWRGAACGAARWYWPPEKTKSALRRMMEVRRAAMLVALFREGREPTGSRASQGRGRKSGLACDAALPLRDSAGLPRGVMPAATGLSLLRAGHPGHGAPLPQRIGNALSIAREAACVNSVGWAGAASLTANPAGRRMGPPLRGVARGRTPRQRALDSPPLCTGEGAGG